MQRVGEGRRIWLLETTPSARRTLIAATAGYGLDGFDFLQWTVAWLAPPDIAWRALFWLGILPKTRGRRLAP